MEKQITPQQPAVRKRKKRRRLRVGRVIIALLVLVLVIFLIIKGILLLVGLFTGDKGKDDSLPVGETVYSMP